MSNTNPKLGRLAKLGLLAALSIVLVFFIHFPIFPTAKFLEYDPADIPIMIATFAFGPWYGLMTTIVVAVVQGLTVSASGGIYGIIMHIIATGTFVLVAGFLYQKHKTKKGALIALLCGVVAWGLIMMPANLIITPIFTGMPVEAIRAILLPIILPFNLIKAGINAVVTFLVYKSVSPLLHRRFYERTVLLYRPCHRGTPSRPHPRLSHRQYRCHPRRTGARLRRLRRVGHPAGWHPPCRRD